MNNSFPRLIDGICATLRREVLPRLDDEFARGQVFGIVNLLNTFKVRADWSAGFLLQQIDAQQQALDGMRALVSSLPGASDLPPPAALLPAQMSIAELLALRDSGNRALADVLAWIDAAALAPPTAAAAAALLRGAMRAEVDIELKNAPRPLFAEMSSGREG